MDNITPEQAKTLEDVKSLLRSVGLREGIILLSGSYELHAVHLGRKPMSKALIQLANKHINRITDWPYN